eukprot:g1884.t1
MANRHTPRNPSAFFGLQHGHADYSIYKHMVTRVLGREIPHEHSNKFVTKNSEGVSADLLQCRDIDTYKKFWRDLFMDGYASQELICAIMHEICDFKVDRSGGNTWYARFTSTTKEISDADILVSEKKYSNCFKSLVHTLIFTVLFAATPVRMKVLRTLRKEWESQYSKSINSGFKEMSTPALTLINNLCAKQEWEDRYSNSSITLQFLITKICHIWYDKDFCSVLGFKKFPLFNGTFVGQKIMMTNRNRTSWQEVNHGFPFAFNKYKNLLQSKDGICAFQAYEYLLLLMRNCSNVQDNIGQAHFRLMNEVKKFLVWPKPVCTAAKRICDMISKFDSCLPGYTMLLNIGKAYPLLSNKGASCFQIFERESHDAKKFAHMLNWNREYNAVQIFYDSTVSRSQFLTNLIVHLEESCESYKEDIVIMRALLAQVSEYFICNDLEIKKEFLKEADFPTVKSIFICVQDTLLASLKAWAAKEANADWKETTRQLRRKRCKVWKALLEELAVNVEALKTEKLTSIHALRSSVVHIPMVNALPPELTFAEDLETMKQMPFANPISKRIQSTSFLISPCSSYAEIPSTPILKLTEEHIDSGGLWRTKNGTPMGHPVSQLPLEWSGGKNYVKIGEADHLFYDIKGRIDRRPTMHKCFDAFGKAPARLCIIGDDIVFHRFVCAFVSMLHDRGDIMYKAEFQIYAIPCGRSTIARAIATRDPWYEENVYHPCRKVFPSLPVCSRTRDDDAEKIDVKPGSCFSPVSYLPHFIADYLNSAVAPIDVQTYISQCWGYGSTGTHLKSGKQSSRMGAPALTIPFTNGIHIGLPCMALQFCENLEIPKECITTTINRKEFQSYINPFSEQPMVVRLREHKFDSDFPVAWTTLKPCQYVFIHIAMLPDLQTMSNGNAERAKITKNNYCLRLNLVDLEQTRLRLPLYYELWNWEGDERPLPGKWFSVMKQCFPHRYKNKNYHQIERDHHREFDNNLPTWTVDPEKEEIVEAKLLHEGNEGEDAKDGKEEEKKDTADQNDNSRTTIDKRPSSPNTRARTFSRITSRKVKRITRVSSNKQKKNTSSSSVSPPSSQATFSTPTDFPQSSMVFQKRYVDSPYFDKKGIFFVTNRSDVIATCMVWQTSEEMDSNMAHIRWLGVTPKHRRQGIGAALIYHALKRMKDRGFKQANIHYENDSFLVLNLLKKFKFYCVGPSQTEIALWDKTTSFGTKEHLEFLKKQKKERSSSGSSSGQSSGASSRIHSTKKNARINSRSHWFGEVIDRPRSADPNASRERITIKEKRIQSTKHRPSQNKNGGDRESPTGFSLATLGSPGNSIQSSPLFERRRLKIPKKKQ